MGSAPSAPPLPPTPPGPARPIDIGVQLARQMAKLKAQKGSVRNQTLLTSPHGVELPGNIPKPSLMGS